MSPDDIQLGEGLLRPDALFASWPTIALLLFCLTTLATWVGVHLLRRRVSVAWPVEVPFLVGRMLIGAVCLWGICSLLTRITNFEFMANWPLWFICFISAVCLEAILSLYRLERQIVHRRVGLALFSLRVSMVLLLGFMLAQPVITTIFTATDSRIVAVLVDDSASMDVIDTQLTDTEKLRLVEILEPSLIERPRELEQAEQAWQPLLKSLRAESAALLSLRSVADATAGERAKGQQRSIARWVGKARRTMQQQYEQIARIITRDAKPSDKTGTLLQGLQTRLDAETKPALQAVDQAADHLAAAKPEERMAAINRLERALSEATAKVETLLVELSVAAGLLDTDLLASLPEKDRQRIDQVVAQSRGQIAKSLMIGASDGDTGLVDRIGDDYEVRVYRFSSEASRVDSAGWKQTDLQQLAKSAEQIAGAVSVGTGGSDATDADKRVKPTRLATDMRAALKAVAADVSAKSLGGIILIGDGHHNGEESPEVVVRQFAAEGVPVSTIAVGGRRSPVDLAVMAVDSPRTVVIEDRVDIEAKIKVAGLNGQKIRVKLFETGGARDPADASNTGSPEGEPLDEQIIDVASDPFETEVILSATPTEQRVHHFHVVTEMVDDNLAAQDVIEQNSRRSLRVSVTDERINILIVEGRPRYEFRFLRNLLAGRDQNVRLQTVLLAPDTIAELPPPEPVNAAVGRAAEKTEATLLPADEAEWMKFDLIILGDVSPEQLGDGADEILRRFVSERGGTLIVVAGSNAMPHAYHGTALAEILPIITKPIPGALLAGPEPSFAVALTSTGRDDPILRQSTEGEENVLFWENLPPLYWRHPGTSAKPNAKVLAYATTEEQEDKLDQLEKDQEMTVEDLLAKRRARERENALIVTHHVGAGRVLALTTDRTWRLRYRVGDKHHHKLWGQMLRWAQTDKLQAGTSLVRLGTSQTSYDVDEPIIVRARIVDEEFNAVEDPEAAVRVYQDSELLLTRRLNPLTDSGGRWQASIDQLPGAGGEYRLELFSPASQELLELEGADGVETVIDVQTRQNASREMLDLTTDRDALAKLADDGGGEFVEVNGSEKLIATLRKPESDEVEQERFRIWDSWPLLLLMVGVVTAEWTIRKKVGLA